MNKNLFLSQEERHSEESPLIYKWAKPVTTLKAKRDTDGFTRTDTHRCRATFCGWKKQSEITGLDGKLLGRRAVEREKEAALQGIADRICLYQNRRQE